MGEKFENEVKEKNIKDINKIIEFIKELDDYEKEEFAAYLFIIGKGKWTRREAKDFVYRIRNEV